MKHGLTAYNEDRCRCPECRAAKSASYRRSVERLRAKRGTWGEAYEQSAQQREVGAVDRLVSAFSLLADALRERAAA